MNSISVSSHFPPLPELSGGVAEVMALMAQRHPDRDAVSFQGETITYGRLYATARYVSAALARVGIIQGDKVGVLFPNHPDFIATFFAVCGLGATVVPINPLLKSEEIQHILQDADAKALIVHEAAAQEAATAINDVPGLEHLFIFAYDPKGKEVTLPLSQSVKSRVTITQFNRSYVPPGDSSDTAFGWTRSLRREEDLAVIVYTSGTTGKPKGAMLSHHNLLTAVENAHAVLAVSENDRTFGGLPLCHIYGLTVVMLGTISRGGMLSIMEKFEARKALDLIAKDRVTIIPAVPTMYQFMVMEMSKSNQWDLSSVRVCLCGGAPLPVELYDSLSAFVKAPLIEGYGLTEVSCVATLNPLEGKQVRGSVGLPLPGVQIGIRTPEGEFLPRGEKHVGEVVIRGQNVMRGYYKKADTTREVLKESWFLTGDLGYLDEEGYLFIVGRAKELIIRGGQNIYPREVENVIARMEQVQEVAVLGVPDPLMGERVKAVIVVKSGKSLSPEEVKQFCLEHLAEYKVPRLVQFVDLLPRNSTGKVLKRMLID